MRFALRTASPESRPRRGIAVGSPLLATVALGTIAIVTAAVATAQPFVPRDDDHVLERLPAPRDEILRELRRLGEDVRQNPGDLDRALRLAMRYIEVGRAESDPRYDGRAQAVLGPWWSLDPPPIRVLVLRATLRQRRHDFEGALSDLSIVLAAQPDHQQALLTRAVVHQVRGRFGEAVRDCEILKPSVVGLARAICVESARGLSGELPGSYARLEAALARSSGRPSVHLWALTALGEMAERMGRPVDADRHFREALSVGIRDEYLLGGYADFLLDHGRADEAVQLLSGESRTDGLLLRLALAEQRTGGVELGEHVRSLRARFEASRRRGDAVHQREEARFTLHLLNEPSEALSLARENWHVQREPWDARLFLEAALASHRTDAAAPVIDWLERTGLEDVRLESLSMKLSGEAR